MKPTADAAPRYRAGDRARDKRGPLLCLALSGSRQPPVRDPRLEKEGWTRRSAGDELLVVMARVRRGEWRPAEPDVAPDHDPDPSFHLFASEWFEGARPELRASTRADYKWQLSHHRKTRGRRVAGRCRPQTKACSMRCAPCSLRTTSSAASSREPISSICGMLAVFEPESEGPAQDHSPIWLDRVGRARSGRRPDPRPYSLGEVSHPVPRQVALPARGRQHYVVVEAVRRPMYREPCQVKSLGGRNRLAWRRPLEAHWHLDLGTLKNGAREWVVGQAIATAALDGSGCREPQGGQTRAGRDVRWLPPADRYRACAH